MREDWGSDLALQPTRWLNCELFGPTICSEVCEVPHVERSEREREMENI